MAAGSVLTYLTRWLYLNVPDDQVLFNFSARLFTLTLLLVDWCRQAGGSAQEEVASCVLMVPYWVP